MKIEQTSVDNFYCQMNRQEFENLKKVLVYMSENKLINTTVSVTANNTPVYYQGRFAGVTVNRNNPQSYEITIEKLNF